MTQTQLIILFALDIWLASVLIAGLCLLWFWIRNWQPSGSWGMLAEGAKVAVMALVLVTLIILLADSYNFWSGL